MNELERAIQELLITLRDRKEPKKGWFKERAAYILDLANGNVVPQEPTIEELAEQEVEREARELKLQALIQKKRKAHPDIDTSQAQT